MSQGSTRREGFFFDDVFAHVGIVFKHTRLVVLRVALFFL